MTITTSKTSPAGLNLALAPLEKDPNGVWLVRGYAEARAVLLAETRQAGFNVETLDQMPDYMARPVLYQDGKVHQEQRKQTARFFTPTVVQENYLPMMEKYVDEALAVLTQAREYDLNLLSARVAVSVAAEVVGLTNSSKAGLTRRLDTILHSDLTVSKTLRGWLTALSIRAQTLAFYWVDVRPAIRARKRVPQQDVISHLISKNYNDGEILAECITYGAAGMVTTQEFICVAAWHLISNPELKERFLNGEAAQRSRILYEILRLEPVVGHLYRRAAVELTIPTPTGEVVIPAGALIDLDIYAINADARTTGADPLELNPERPLDKGVSNTLMSFGFGSHRCAGEFIAMAETDAFLQKLLRLPGLRIVRAPDVSSNDLTKGYEIRQFIIAVD